MTQFQQGIELQSQHKMFNLIFLISSSELVPLMLLARSQLGCPSANTGLRIALKYTMPLGALES
jgi:hypothetical protein